MQKNKIVSIVGLTASGKSGLGIELARQFNGEIISADSRQVYKGLDIGTGKVTVEERAMVPHHILDIVEPVEHYNVFEFQKLAYEKIEDILKRGKVPFIVGGTGMYSRSVVDGYNFNAPSEPKYDVLQICIMPSKEYIRGNIERRLDARIKEGMIEETRGLLAKGYSRDFLSSLGLEYYWNIEYIEGRITLEEYRENLFTKIRQFAKRQRTWFKKERQEITHYLEVPEKFLGQSVELVGEFLNRHCE